MGHDGPRVFARLCVFFKRGSQMSVVTMGFPCTALNVKVVRNSKQARTNDRRNHDSHNCSHVCSDRSSLSSSFLLFSCSCFGVFCVVLCCAVLHCAVLLCHVSGVEQLYQARRLIAGIGNVLCSTYFSNLKLVKIQGFLSVNLRST